ncbi:MAG TPA: serine/threonine-protein kinase [Thermoanaerobaculia bacterium]|nr:serine/threonine-protein kinase [Thermoanaerobaculia bacterium]
MTADGTAAPRTGAASSPWSSEESREFLQERVAHFSGVCFWVMLLFFIAGWLIAAAWVPNLLEGGLPVRDRFIFHLGSTAVLLVMWLVTRGRPVPVEVVRMLDSGGVIISSWGMTANAFTIPLNLRPDLVAIVSFFGFLLYRAAVVPSEPKRTAWIGLLSALPLPVMTFLFYSRGPRPSWMPPPIAYTAYEVLFTTLVVLLSSKISRVIYGLRQTIRATRRLGPYTLETKIGEGGMGAVYRARHALLRRPTAIKILPPERAGEMDMTRFEREVQMTSQLTSPHTVSVYDYGRTPDGLFYYAMEYLDGIDLDELVARDGPMPPGRVANVLSQVCEALGEAHRAGLIHRDIKPANILLCERGGRHDVVKVVDFGLVKDLAKTSGPGVTTDNLVLGTPHYIAPEVLRSPDRIDARSDLYALGATAYFLLTGKPVFEGGLPEIFAQHLDTAPTPPSARLGRPIPRSLEALVMAALSKDPNHRPQSTAVFDSALRDCRDVAPWNEADAATWWRGRGARIRAARAGSPTVPGTTQQQTLEVGRGAPAAAAGGSP